MAKTPPSFLEKRLPFLLFSFLYLLAAALTYRDYGETWDESGVYTRGLVLGHYFAGGSVPGLLHRNSPADGLVLYDHWYAWALSLLNPGADIAVYHWLNLLFGLLLFAAAYEALLARTQKPWIALLGPAFLFLMPRLTGALPADPKDGPFAVLYFTSLAAVFFMARRPISPWFKVPALGLLFGLTTAQRLVGFTLFLVWPLHEWILWRWGLKPKARRKGSGARPVLLYAGVFFISQLVLAATWPYLAADYFHRLPELLKAAKDYPWNDPVLFLGREIPASGLPRTYLPVFLLVTTPLLALFWFAASFRALRKPQADPLWALLGLALGLNLALYLILKPVVYDGLRHFLFLLPLMAVMAACGLADLLARPRAPGRRPLLALSALLGVLALADMARLHPYEYVYFNELTGGLKGAQGRFETDYWGASYKEAVDWVQAQEPPGDTPLWVHSNGNPYQVACYLNGRTHWTDDLGKADYYLATTRDGANLSVDPARRVHRVEREGVPLCDVFKLK